MKQLLLAFLFLLFSTGLISAQSDSLTPAEGYKNFAYNLHFSYGTIGVSHNYTPDSVIYWPNNELKQVFGIGVGLIFDRWDLEVSFRTLYNYRDFNNLIKDAILTSYFISGGYNLFPNWKKTRWDVRFGLGINPGMPIYNGKGAAGLSDNWSTVLFANRIETQWIFPIFPDNPRAHLNPALRIGMMWTYIKKQVSRHGINFFPRWPVHFYASFILNMGVRERNERMPTIDHLYEEF